MAKMIITHFNPDLDAVASVWLLKRFLPGWQEAEVKFVPPGEYTLDKEPVDASPDVFYVDTGRGKFDHHQTNKDICAASLVWDFIKRKTGSKDEAVERLIKIVNEIDHAKDLVWSDADNDRYEMMLHMVLEGFKRKGGDSQNSQRIVDFGRLALDGAYKMYQQKVLAEEELKRGEEFETKWGKAIALETKNDAVLFLGEKKGYSLVVRLNPQIKHLSIYARWDKGVNLTFAFEKFKKKDPGPSWFLHSSGVLLSNGASSQPDYQPTKLTLSEIIKVLKRA